MDGGYLLVLLMFWLDPDLGATEERYQVRIAGHYNTLARCEERRRAFSANTKNALILFSECRRADGAMLGKGKES